MSKKPEIFLESHHIKNLNFGFGQFNYHLIKAIHKLQQNDLSMTLHAKNIEALKADFGSAFNYKKYSSLSRYPLFRIRKKYDLWHSMNQNTKIEPYHDLPYLLTVHNISYIKDKNDYKTKENHVAFQEKLNRSHAITYISNYAKTSTHAFFDVPKVPEHIIYNGNTIADVSLPEDHKPKIAPKKPFLFAIGEFTKRKNFQTLVAMLQFLPDLHLVLSGKNQTSHAAVIEEAITRYGLKNRVFITGKISELDKHYYYKHCDAFVFPSLREGFGLPVIEAMRFGKPVFLSNNTSLPEIGKDLAFYWDNYDPEYMANIVMDGLTTFSANQEHYIKSSVEHAQSFSWKNAAKDYLGVYKQLVGH